MNSNLINKISKLVKSSINEAFDFDEEFNNLDEPGSIKVIAADMLEGFELYAIRDENAKIPFKDIFLGLYKCKLPFAAPTATIEVQDVGPMWYIPKQYKDIKNLICYTNYNCSYTGQELVYNNILRRDWKSLIQNKWQWFYSMPRRNYNSYTLNKLAYNNGTIDPVIMKLLEILGKNVGIGNMQNFMQPNFPHYVSIFVSPDNGIVIIDIIANADSLHDTYNNGYFNTELPMYSNMVFFTGLVKYEKNTEVVNQNKAALKETSVLSAVTERIFTLIHASYYDKFFYDPHNALPHIILDDNDHYVLPLGDKFFTYTNQKDKYMLYANTPPTGRPPRLANNQVFSEHILKLAGSHNANRYIMNWIFADKINRKYDWHPIYVKPSLIVYEHNDYPYIKIFMTPKENLIEQLFGLKVLSLCKEGRDIIYQGNINTNEDIKIYGVLWFGEEINDLVEAIFNRKTTIGAFKKATVNRDLTNFIANLPK